MRIWYQYPGPVSPFRKDVVWNSVHAVIDRVKRPETEIMIVPTERGAHSNEGMLHYARNLSNQEIIDTISGAGEGGYDGAIIGVSSDSGIIEAREILPIPVVGLTESACHYATIWGERFAVITNAIGDVGVRKHQYYRRAMLTRYGVLDRCIGVTPLDMPPEKYRDDLARRQHDEILTRFEAIARRYIAEGADVIMAGDTILSMALVEHNVFEIPGTGAVVVDLMSSAVKLMESLVDIHKAFGIVRSRAGLYAAPKAGQIARIRESYGITQPHRPDTVPIGE